ncbi:capsular polysaccharide biosynthesis protein [Marinobacterium nitratireducens]|uniref:Capsular polysaccharide biosynthesis protein n=1 Tax=Marinobacterium nitratireducens TaxID=518897 RepID=A0A918DQI3_9GAMM|nr:capsular biosynthesis protein [Marinobacterium nitratireducens]GGO79480.1 capsular polysaccharide biosynthesis protein [Marinobacterium nitratireducens]
MKRLSFLLLQGPATPFFARLADTLLEQGHRVFKVNFCTGDTLFRNRAQNIVFDRPIEHWDAFLADLVERHGIDRVLLFGDCRPLHRRAIEQLKALGIKVHVYEEGYFRPNWITLEAGGTNGFSSLPKDPEWYLREAEKIAHYGDGDLVGGSLKVRAIQDMAYHISNLANPVLYPEYRTHRPHASHIEYLGWAQRFSRLPWRERRARQICQRLTAEQRPYYLFPLQLNSDYQIKVHSDFSGMPDAIAQVMRSFAEQAPRRAMLVIKNHPLDNGLINYRRLIEHLAGKLGLGRRVLFIDGGHLPTLLHSAKGVVTVNSTVGLSALFHGRPTQVLGKAIYNMRGLTHQGSLDSFWRQKQGPDKQLFHAFRNTIIHRTQLNGGFYNQRGIELAVQGSVQRLTQGAPIPVAEPVDDFAGEPAWES